jgi:hypothetical protein
MLNKTRVLLGSLLLVASQAQATLILNTGITESFQNDAMTTGTHGNDLPGHPNTLYFGQLGATANGWVDFYYIGNEAGYTNSLRFGTTTHSTAGLPDNFNSSLLLGSLAVTANSLLDFRFCTDGGESFGMSGRCAINNSGQSLMQQFNRNLVGGYRSIAYAGLSSFNPQTGARTYSPGNPGISNLWMLFWDDSGARNDDNHDDYVAVASFRPERETQTVPEPGTLGLVAIGLAGLMFAARRGTMLTQAR